MKYLFGPVNSRRFGMSLGVDLVPHKTCSLNCVYCECGETTRLTSTVAEYVPTDAVISELDRYLAASPGLDVVTFSGSGEPTLHSGIGRIIAHLKSRYPGYRVVVLTNGTLLWNESVRRAIARADIVVPSLDAVTPEAFDRIGRPAAGITPERVIGGLVDFRKEFGGRLILEIFIVPGVNDTATELAALREACHRIGPDMVQINSLDRPGAAVWVRAAAEHELIAIRDYLLPLPVEIIGKPAARACADAPTADLMKSILSTLRRRPSTMEDLLASLGVDRDVLRDLLDSMREKGMITAETLDRGEFFRAV
jgi:wyosine [tRNA(Phe)-imidazoG37] synthetase (radical SAM superfamily)